MSSKAAIKKLPPLPCKTNRNPLTSGESRSITHDVKYFDTHDVNIPSDFPYHLPQANRPSYYTISYFQFQSPQSAKAFPNVGSPGDVWLKTAPGSQIFYKASKWIEWESGTSVLESATDRQNKGEHPLLPGLYLWFQGRELNWRVRNTVTRNSFHPKGRAKHTTPVENIVSAIADTVSEPEPSARKRKADIKPEEPSLKLPETKKQRFPPKPRSLQPSSSASQSMAIPSAAPYAQPRRRTRLPHEGLKTQVLSGMLEKKAGNTRQKASEYLRLGTLSSQQPNENIAANSFIKRKTTTRSSAAARSSTYRHARNDSHQAPKPSTSAVASRSSSISVVASEAAGEAEVGDMIDLTVDDPESEAEDVWLEARIDPLSQFIINLDLDIDVKKILSYFQADGAGTLRHFRQLAQTAQEDNEAFEKHHLKALKADNLTSWTTVGRELKKVDLADLKKKIDVEKTR